MMPTPARQSRLRHHRVQYDRPLVALLIQRVMLLPRVLGRRWALRQSVRCLLEARRSALSKERAWEHLGWLAELLLAQPGPASLSWSSRASGDAEGRAEARMMRLTLVVRLVASGSRV